MSNKYYTVIWLTIDGDDINTECRGIFDTEKQAHDELDKIKENVLSDVDEDEAEIDEYDYKEHDGNTTYKFSCSDSDRLDEVYIFEKEKF